MSENQYINYHNQSFKNREQIEASDGCVCINCSKKFTANEITEWVDEDKTAICPHCGVDSVLPSSEQLTPELVKDLHDVWFSRLFAVDTTEDKPTEA